jgi:hypothetical protein
MTTTDRITAEHPRCEHPVNGVQTGSDGEQIIVIAAKLLCELAKGWKEENRLDVVFFRAIANLSQRFPERANQGYDAWELAEEIGKIQGRRWTAGDTRELVSDKVRKQWSRLDETWAMKREGVLQSFEQRKMAFLAEPDRVGGGGQGNPTRYRIMLTPIRESEKPGMQGSSPTDSAAAGASQTAPEDPMRIQIDYICEDLEDVSFLARSFSRGFNLVGWRRGALRFVLFGGILLASLAVGVFALPLVGAQSLTKLVYAGISMTMVYFVFWITLGSILMLSQRRVTLAPWWMQSVDDDRLLEWRGPPRYATKSIKAARYTAECPLCGGKVVVKSGGLRHIWGLVGCCEEAPSAHKYSFDHVLRKGVRMPSL